VCVDPRDRIGRAGPGRRLTTRSRLSASIAAGSAPIGSILCCDLFTLVRPSAFSYTPVAGRCGGRKPEPAGASIQICKNGYAVVAATITSTGPHGTPQLRRRVNLRGSRSRDRARAHWSLGSSICALRQAAADRSPAAASACARAPTPSLDPKVRLVRLTKARLEALAYLQAPHPRLFDGPPVHPLRSAAAGRSPLEGAPPTGSARRSPPRSNIGHVAALPLRR
jgi:hypothetical protein